MEISTWPHGWMSGLDTENFLELKSAIQDETNERKADYLKKHAELAGIPDDEVKEIVESSYRAYDLTLDDFCKVELAFREEDDRLAKLPGISARMYPIVKLIDPDDEYNLLFGE